MSKHTPGASGMKMQVQLSKLRSYIALSKTIDIGIHLRKDFGARVLIAANKLAVHTNYYDFQGTLILLAGSVEVMQIELSSPKSSQKELIPGPSKKSQTDRLFFVGGLFLKRL